MHVISMRITQYSIVTNDIRKCQPIILFVKNKNKGNKNIKRFDKGKIKGEQDHVHFDDGAALNKDGSWKHGQRELTQEERNYLQENGWTIE